MQTYFSVLYMDNIPTWVAVVISVCIGASVALVVQLVLVPWQRAKILGELAGQMDCLGALLIHNKERRHISFWPHYSFYYY